VQTADAIVDEMLKGAGVTAADVVYDLGSGDGRIVIAAARQYGARGVGIDIDPERIAESNANAESAGVTDRVRFIEQDLFEADLSEASVVTLYLLPSINARLRPKLLRELRPGARVVSHNYDMGDWTPARAVTIPAVHYANDNHTIYFWTVPAR
jgi:ribosomal protein L11 methylase PrmA